MRFECDIILKSDEQTVIRKEYEADTLRQLSDLIYDNFAANTIYSIAINPTLPEDAV